MKRGAFSTGTFTLARLAVVLACRWIKSSGACVSEFTRCHIAACEKRAPRQTFSKRARLEAACLRFLPKITDADLSEYRREHAWTTWKCAMCKLPMQEASGRSRCSCGAAIDIASMSDHVRLAHME